MKRLQWDKDRDTANLSPHEKEILALKDENRRLQGLLELREDRTALERFQIQSRNRILYFMAAGLAAITIAFFSFLVLIQAQSAKKDESLKRDNDIITKLKGKRGAVYTPTSADEQNNN
jgi:hypothetical protein